MRSYEEIFAVNSLVNLLVCLVLHIEWIIGLHRVDDDLLGELNGQSVLVNGDLLDIVAASDLHTCLRH